MELLLLTEQGSTVGGGQFFFRCPLDIQVQMIMQELGVQGEVGT